MFLVELIALLVMLRIFKHAKVAQKGSIYNQTFVLFAGMVAKLVKAKQNVHLVLQNIT